ncbi:serine protease [Klebsiella sp. 2019SCSN059]|uniref:serine protease n=1 Tax=Klebsiella sp. 2019SCSN059 TaxID=2911173 RepID=UPI001CF20BEA|nr:serine protease [Klebsiella sp. 2019SCSN059]MCB3515929.1 serine protease [Klebsiella pneumoniae]MCB3642892.1 serine protease [Klebsiella pneumoniae]MCF8600607.1 serine protease [Klebsiella sp. 2019SCSN059]
MKILIVAIILSLLTGCVGHTEYSKEAIKRTDLNFIAIPTVLGLGMTGSSVPITPDYSLTAAHVAKFMMYRVKAYHPSCDLALIYHKNNEKSYPLFRNSGIGENITMYGHSFITAMPVESDGKVLTDTITINTWNKAACPLYATSAGVVVGMSGGAVYNKQDNTLAGIVHGYARRINRDNKIIYKDTSLYVPYERFSSWLNHELTQ